MRILLPLFMILMMTVNGYASGNMVTYEVDGAEYEGYYTSKTQGAPLLLLIHDWDGLTDYEEKRAEMLAGLGYSVFAADLFGKGVRPTEVKDKKQHTGELYKDRQKMRALLNGAFEQGVKLGGDGSNLVVFGYCFGGAAVLEMARSGAKAKAFVTFHGGLSTPEGQDYTKASGSIVVFHGTADTAITMDDFASLAAELEVTGVNHEMVTYSGAPHAFTVIGSKRYHEASDKKSWARFLELLDVTVKSS